jgi:hypothetical protein
MNDTPEKKPLEFPKYRAHWPSKAVDVCKWHAEQLAGLASVMGFKLPISLLIETPTGNDMFCINCVNEVKRNNPQFEWPPKPSETEPKVVIDD